MSCMIHCSDARTNAAGLTFEPRGACRGIRVDLEVLPSKTVLIRVVKLAEFPNIPL